MPQLSGAFSDKDFHVRLLRIYLAECHFGDATAEEVVEFPSGARFSFELAFARESALRLTVFLTVSTESDDEDLPLQASITYAGELEAQYVPPDRLEDVMIYAGYDLGPRTLYPYIRELFGNLTARWRGGAVTLPYLPIPIDPPEDRSTAIPPPPDDTWYQRELPIGEESEEEDDAEAKRAVG